MGVSDILQTCSKQNDVSEEQQWAHEASLPSRVCELAELLVSPGRELAFPLPSLSAPTAAAECAERWGFAGCPSVFRQKSSD